MAVGEAVAIFGSILALSFLVRNLCWSLINWIASKYDNQWVNISDHLMIPVSGSIYCGTVLLLLGYVWHLKRDHPLFILFLMAFALYLVWLVNRILRLLREKIRLRLSNNVSASLQVSSGDEQVLNLIQGCIQFLLGSVLVIVILEEADFDTSKFITGLGFGTVAIGIASQSIFTDLLGCLYVLKDRIYAVGDVIKVDKFQGMVLAIGLRYTQLRTASGDVIHISNKIVSSTSITKISHDDRCAFLSKVVAFYIPISQSEQVQQFLQVAKKLVASQPIFENPRTSISIKDTDWVNYYVTLRLRANVDYFIEQFPDKKQWLSSKHEDFSPVQREFDHYCWLLIHDLIKLSKSMGLQAIVPSNSLATAD